MAATARSLLFRALVPYRSSDIPSLIGRRLFVFPLGVTGQKSEKTNATMKIGSILASTVLLSADKLQWELESSDYIAVALLFMKAKPLKEK